MADTKISALSAGTALAGTEEIPIVQSSSTVKATPAQIKTYALTTPLAVVGNSTAGAEIRLPEDTDNGSDYVAIKAPSTLAASYTLTLPADDGNSGEVLSTNGSGTLSWASAPGASAPLTLASGTITSDSNALTITQTWNSSGVSFSGGLKINVTDTSSASTSLLAAFQVGGTTLLSITKGGGINHSSYLGINGGGGVVFQSGGTNRAQIDNVVNFGVGTGRFSFGSGVGGTDVGFIRHAAGVVKVVDGSTGAGVLGLPTFTVSGLPSAATAGAGARTSVSDSSVTTFGTTVSGGGSTVVPVYSDGTNWKVG